MKNITKAYRHTDNKIGNDNINENHDNFYYAKPSRGLTLNKLYNIPKELSKSTNSSFNFLRESICGNKSRRNLEFTRETVSKFIQSNRSKKKYDFIESPTSHYTTTQRSTNNKEKLDFNSSYGQKFLKDAANCGKDKLSTVALHRGSPYKYACVKNNKFSKSKSPNRAGNIELKSSDNNEYLINLFKTNCATDFEEKKSTNAVLSEIIDKKYFVYGKFATNEQNNTFQKEENEKEFRSLNDKQDINNLIITENDNDYRMKTIEKIELIKSITSSENLQERLVHTMESTLSELDFLLNDSSLEQRLDYFLESVNDLRMEIRLGSLVAIFIILKKYYLSDDQKQFILSKTLYLLRHHKIQEELFLITCLEICSLYPNNDLLIQNIELIQFFMSDFDFPKLQKASFYCLMSNGYEGIKSLIELASDREGIYQHFILNNLLQTPHIQKIIIVRALLNDLYLQDSYRKHSSLAALSKMYDLLNDEEILKILYKFLYDTKMEKIMLAITIRNSGLLGEDILLNELITSKEIPIRVAIASAFSFRTPKYPKYLTMKLDNNDVPSIKNNTPGTFCKFVGEIECNLENIDNEKNEDCYLEINTRDFLSSLQRMIALKYDDDNNNIRLVHRGSPYIIDCLNTRSIDYNNSIIIKKYSEFFEFHLCDPMNEQIAQIDEEGKFIVSEEIVRTLSCCLRDQSAAVRETAASSLGKIGLPESLNALDNLILSTKDFDLNVRAKAIWAIGRLDCGYHESAIDSILEALKTNFWKVKSACLFSLSQFGAKCAKKATGPLLKLLKESAINKQNVAETLIKLGVDGESCLICLINSEDDSNYKLKSSIARAFALSDLTSSNIDFIIESLFRAAKSNSFLIKQNAIFSIKILAEKAKENINYLKRKNLIPFFYELLKDKEYSFQMEAVEYFKKLGAQGELILIEGLTKDPSVTIRKNSAIGLSQMGLQTFRTLILGLYDEDWTVRRTVEKEILDNFKINEIIDNFTKENPTPYSIKFTIKDIIEKELFTNKSFSLFLQNLSQEMEKILK